MIPTYTIEEWKKICVGRFLEQAKKLRAVETGWLGTGVAKPSEASIEIALKFASDRYEFQWRFSPTVIGGTQIVSASGCWEIDFGPDGAVVDEYKACQYCGREQPEAEWIIAPHVHSGTFWCSHECVGKSAAGA
jgi:hypothetical protein